MHFYMLMYFWIIVIVSIIMSEARGRVTCICEPSLTIYCRPALLATILVVLQYLMRICAFSVLQIVRVYDHVLMYFTPCTILYIHIQPGWHICHIILEVLSTSYWAGQIGPEKTRPDCPIPNIVPLQCTSPSLTNGCMFLHVFACLQVFLAASPLYCWLKPFCLALLKLPHSKRRLASFTHLFLCLYLCVHIYCISLIVPVLLVSPTQIHLFCNGDASSIQERI